MWRSLIRFRIDLSQREDCRTIIPTSTAFANVDKEMASAAFNWFFSIQPDELPERLIGAERIFYLHWILDHWSGTKGALATEAVAEYERLFRYRGYERGISRGSDN
jgi:hypothetical protein